jgi:hypothetical protein
MSVRPFLTSELSRLTGLQGGLETVRVAGPKGESLEVDLVAVDSMSCAFSELRLEIPRLRTGGFPALEKWAKALSGRVTYLLENLAPLEFDPALGQVMLRSVKPDQLPDGSQYYEIILSTSGLGCFSLKRFRTVKGVPGRDPVPIQTTHEVLLKLCDDLLATAP